MKDKITVGEKYGPAMEIQNQAEADAYFLKLVAHNMKLSGRTRKDAEAVERSNLGYFAGYYSNATRETVERLFRCSHPVFGSIAKNGAPTPEQAFELGKQMARKRRDRH
jgi:hypothetical protein